MAQKRMFSLRIINSARFLKMPIDSQVLYFHLGMRADDDGIVEAYPIMQMLGNSEDNLKVLIAKNLIKVLNEDLVTYISDWREHNLIRADRKVDSIYKNLLLQIIPDADLIEPKPRADTGVIPRQLTGRPLDGIGKVRLGKDNTIIPKDLITYSLTLWNNHSSTDGLNLNNITNTKAKTHLLPHCRSITPSIEKCFTKLAKYTQEDVKTAVGKYITEIVNRNPSNDYANHRFSFYEFFKQENGFIKFLNK